MLNPFFSRQFLNMACVCFCFFHKSRLKVTVSKQASNIYFVKKSEKENLFRKTNDKKGSKFLKQKRQSLHQGEQLWKWCAAPARGVFEHHKPLTELCQIPESISGVQLCIANFHRLDLWCWILDFFHMGSRGSRDNKCGQQFVHQKGGEGGEAEEINTETEICVSRKLFSGNCHFWCHILIPFIFFMLFRMKSG